MDRYRIAATPMPNASSQISLPPKPHLPASPLADDAFELSIFDAQRYFNENPPPSIKSHALVSDCSGSSVSSLDGLRLGLGLGLGPNWRSSLYAATPTASSETSWNSQSGLLTNPPGSISVSVKAFPASAASKPNRRLFTRSCCLGKKSVTVDEKSPEPRSPARKIFNSSDEVDVQENEVVNQVKIVAGGWRREGDLHFFTDSGRLSPNATFPTELAQRILKPNAAAFSFPVLNTNTSTVNDPPRASLEVFRPASEELRVVRKPKTPALALPPSSFTLPLPSSPKPAAGVEDDVASDTSSDLFEIESFSTQYHRRRDSLEEAPAGRIAAANGIVRLHRSIEEEVGAPSECYAPSEVSVEWSVTTAEGYDRGSVANFSSAASEFDELRYAGAEHDRLAAATVAAGKKRGNGLLSCRCEKAVSVGPIPVKYAPEHRRPGGGVVVSVAEPDGGRVTARLGGWNEGKERPRLSRPRSTR